MEVFDEFGEVTIIVGGLILVLASSSRGGGTYITDAVSYYGRILTTADIVHVHVHGRFTRAAVKWERLGYGILLEYLRDTRVGYVPYVWYKLADVKTIKLIHKFMGELW